MGVSAADRIRLYPNVQIFNHHWNTPEALQRIGTISKEEAALLTGGLLPAEVMYKTEPVVADGGEVIIYAPHISEISYTHGELIDKVGYHVRDYFLKQWDRFNDVPGGILAHSTHVKGQGTYDSATGVETPCIHVTLATGIPEERCRRVNLGYADYRTINPDAWAGREADDILLVRHAGEMLYRSEALDGAGGGSEETLADEAAWMDLAKVPDHDAKNA